MYVDVDVHVHVKYLFKEEACSQKLNKARLKMHFLFYSIKSVYISVSVAVFIYYIFYTLVANHLQDNICMYYCIGNN